jgi:hypothetical protein
MSLDCCLSPLQKTITFFFQGQLKWEVIYLLHSQVQILEFEIFEFETYISLHLYLRNDLVNRELTLQRSSLFI